MGVGVLSWVEFLELGFLVDGVWGFLYKHRRINIGINNGASETSPMARERLFALHYMIITEFPAACTLFCHGTILFLNHVS